MEEFGKPEERVILVGVQTGENDNVEESLDEEVSAEEESAE